MLQVCCTLLFCVCFVDLSLARAGLQNSNSESLSEAHRHTSRGR